MSKTLQGIMSSDIDDIFLTDFAVDATYTPSGGVVKTIKVVFDSEYLSVQVVGDVGVESETPTAHCKTSDLTGVKHNDTLVIEGTTYYVTEIHPDGTGMTLLILSKDRA